LDFTGLSSLSLIALTPTLSRKREREIVDDASMADDDFPERDEDDADGSESPAEVPEPRANPELTGHAAAEDALLEAYHAGKLPHALIIAGPRGVGKATLAFRLARFLMAQSAEPASAGLFGAAPPPRSLALAPDHPVFRRIAAGGHADLITVERGRDPRKKERLRGEIVVEDTRGVASFLRLTPAEGGWRIVIVDSADDMNRNAANALLKILEEPPRRSLLMLVSHNPGRLLPTIRSRCRKLTLKPLPDNEVVRLIAHYRPDIASEDARALALLAEGSIGRALELQASGGLDLYRSLLKLMQALPDIDGPSLHSFADRLAKAGAEDTYRTVTELLSQFLTRMISRAARGSDGIAGEGGWTDIVAGEGQGMGRLVTRRGLDQWVEVWEKVMRLFAQADGLNLDRKQVVLGAFFALEGVARGA
jgi:DNA polymerase-3 subunit delta'